MTGRPSSDHSCKRFQSAGSTRVGLRGGRRHVLGALGAAVAGSVTAGTARAAAPLEVAAFPALDQILQGARPRWNALGKSTDIRLLTREFGDHHAALTAAMAARKGLPDLMAVEFGFLARFAASGALADLSMMPGVADLSPGIVPYALEQCRLAGGVFALPVDIGPGVSFLRADLLERARLSESDLLASWEGFVQSGKRIRAGNGPYLIAHARDLKDAIIRAGLRPGDGIYFDAQGRPLLESPRFRLAFNLAREARQYDLDARVSAWSNDWAEGLRRGRIVALLMGAWFGGHLANWLAPATAGRWRTGELPGGGRASWGGSFYAIAAHSPRRDEAWALLRLLAGDPALQLDAFRRHDAFPALLAAHQDPFFDEALPFFGGQRARQLWREIARAIPPVGVHRLDPLAEEIVNAELDRVLLRGKAPEAALADAARVLERRVARVRS
jgi:multiple sugar transport system substrate-binding protein